LLLDFGNVEFVLRGVARGRPKETGVQVMFDLKRLSSEAIDRSLAKAEHYRLLNEPEEAESICLDVLAISSNNQRAIIVLLLALTDQFPHGHSNCISRAQEVLTGLEGEYERTYYAGIINERQANARLLGGTAGAAAFAYGLYRKAMTFYERAEELSPFGNEDALLRWNTCARQIMRHHLAPAIDDVREPLMLE
jgi:tetratricopeptide (TPR) repeat protein